MRCKYDERRRSHADDDGASISQCLSMIGAEESIRVVLWNPASPLLNRALLVLQGQQSAHAALHRARVSTQWSAPVTDFRWQQQQLPVSDSRSLVSQQDPQQ